MPFDARAAKLLQPGELIRIVPEHPGLRLERSTTRWSWIYRYRSLVDDGVRQIKLGEWPKMGYPDAALEWRKLNEARNAGKDPVLEKRSAKRAAQAAKEERKRSAYTVAMLIQDYLEGHINIHRKPSGRAEVKRVLERETVAIADRPAALLRRNEAFDLLASMAKEKPVIAFQVRQEMGAAWNYGLDSGKLPDDTPNWWKQVMRGKLRSKGKRINGENIGTVKRALSEQELGQLVVWLPNFSKTVADALTLYLWTGTRGGEILPTEKAEIAEEDGVLWWTIPKERTKNARHENASDLRVPLIGRAREVVVRRMAQTDRYLFKAVSRFGYTEPKTIQSTVYTHQPYASRSSRKDNRPILAVTRWTPHDLRRSIRTLLAKMGCPNDVAEAVLGHMIGGIVGVYNRHSYDAERLEWLTKLDARLEAAALASAS